MNQILAHYSASISELKKNPSAIIHNSGGETVAILNHNKPEAYLVSAETYERMLDLLEDMELAQIVRERMKDKEKSIEVKLEDL